MLEPPAPVGDLALARSFLPEQVLILQQLHDTFRHGGYHFGRPLLRLPAVGGGLRLDVALFSFVERITLRFDVAKTVNANTPVQFWFGIQHPF